LKLKVALCISLALLLGFLFSGCSLLVRKTTEKAIEKSTGVEVEEKEGKVKVKTKEGEAEFGSKEFPKDFPEDFPVYTGAGDIASTRVETGEGVSINVSYTVNEDLSAVSDFYKESLPENGYEVDQTVETSQDFVMFHFKKGEGVEGTLSVSKSDGKAEVAISLGISK
jgi:hypothetical protein